MTRLVVAVSLCIVAWATPAPAAFTDAERVSLAALGQAQLDLLTGDNAIQVASRHATLPATHAALAALKAQTRTASFRLHEVHGALLNVRITGTTPPPTVTRDYWLELARSQHKDAVGALAKANAALDAAGALEPDNDAYQGTLRSARATWFPRAGRQFVAVNMTLPYADPWPAAEFTRTGKEIIGPHGDYRVATDRCWWAGRYLDHMRGHVNAIAARGGPVLAISAGLIDTNALQQALTRALLIFARITVVREDAHPTHFLTVLHATEITTEIAAAKFFATSDMLQALVGLPTAQHQDARRAINRFADAWRHLDECTWGMMLFPSMSR